MPLSNAQQFDVKDQGRIRRNRATRGPARSITELWRDSQLPFAAHLHPDDAFIPPLDDRRGAQRLYRKWLATVQRAVELLAISQPPGVVDLRRLARRGSGARTNFNVPVLQAIGCLGTVAGHLRGRTVVSLLAALRKKGGSYEHNDCNQTRTLQHYSPPYS